MTDAVISVTDLPSVEVTDAVTARMFVLRDLPSRPIRSAFGGLLGRGRYCADCVIVAGDAQIEEGADYPDDAYIDLGPPDPASKPKKCPACLSHWNDIIGQRIRDAIAVHAVAVERALLFAAPQEGSRRRPEGLFAMQQRVGKPLGYDRLEIGWFRKPMLVTAGHNKAVIVSEFALVANLTHD